MTSAFTIGGYPIRMNQPVVWSLYTGFQFRTSLFPMDPADAKKLLALEEPVDIVIRGRGKKLMEFKKALVIGEADSPDPFTRVIRVTDLRWKWEHVIFSRNFNEVISSATTRTISPTGIPIALQQDVVDRIYAKYSINPDTGKPWKAGEVLRAVLKEVVGEENTDWVITPAVGRLPEAQVQDLDMPGLGDTGSTAIGRALALVPGAGIYQHYSGKFIVASMVPGEADDIIDSLGPPLDPGQTIRKLDRARDRAKKYVLHFNMEVGVRADAITNEENAVDEDLWMRNVGRTINPTTTLSDGTIVGPGTHLPIEQLIEAFYDYMRNDSLVSSLFTKAGREFTLDNILKRYAYGMVNLWVRGATIGGEPDQVIASMVAEVQRSLRRCYQLNPAYAHQSIAMIPKLPGITDPETSSEAEAAVYTDYAVRPTQIGYARNTKDPGQKYSVNHYGGVLAYWQGPSANGLLANGLRVDSGRPNGGRGARRAPVRMGPINRQGIFTLSFERDPWGSESRILPGALKPETAPSRKYVDQIATFNKSELEEEHRANVVFAMMPGPVGRGDDGKFRHLAGVEVTPEEAAGKLAIASVGKTLGEPVKEEFSAIQPAKFPYTDDAQPDIRAAFGLSPGDEGTASNYSGPFLIQAEAGPATPTNLPALQELALSSAAAYYRQRLDRWSGSKSVPLRGDIELRGEVLMVSHVMTDEGELYTTVEAGMDTVANYDALAGLSQSARRMLQRSVNPTGA